MIGEHGVLGSLDYPIDVDKLRLVRKILKTGKGTGILLTHNHSHETQGEGGSLGRRK